MRASLYLHSKNAQNLRHIVDGGLTVPEPKAYARGDYRSAYARGTTIKGLTEAKIREIVAGMTPYEKRFAEAAGAFFEYGREQINKTSLALNGYKKADVPDYYPINVDTNFLGASFESVKRDATVEGMGILKERKGGATRPILLEDAASVVNRHLEKISTYAGLAIPLRDFQKVYGMSRSEDGGFGTDTSLKQTINRVWGKTGTDYIEHLIADLQGARKQPSGVLDRIKGNFAQGVLTGNPNVMMQQLSAYPIAASVVGWGPLFKALGMGLRRADFALIEKYTPLLWSASKGMTSKELGDITRMTKKPWMFRWNDHLQKIPGIGAISDAFVNGIQKIDVAVRGRLWYAAEYYVRDQFKELGKGSEDYYKKVAEVFNKTMWETQQNYTPMQLQDVLRNPDSLTKSLTMFKTQALQTFGIVYDAVGDFMANRTAEKGRVMVNAVAGQMVGFAAAAALKLLSRAMQGKMGDYEDEEERITPESLALGLLASMAENAAGSLLGGAELYSAVKSLAAGERDFDLEAPVLAAINDMKNSVMDVVDAVAYYGEDMKEAMSDEARARIIKKTVYRLSKSGISLLTSMGVPAQNAQNLAYGLYLNAVDAANGELGTFNAAKEARLTTYSGAYDRMYRALEQGDTKQYNRLAARLKNAEIGSGVARTEKDITAGVIASALREDTRAGAYYEALLTGDAAKAQAALTELRASGLPVWVVDGAIKSAKRKAENARKKGNAS